MTDHWFKNFRFQIDDKDMPRPSMERSTYGEIVRYATVDMPPPVECVLTRASDDDLLHEWMKELGDQSATIFGPASWWQRFKERRFPKWLLRWFPVKYINIVGDIMSVRDLKDGSVELTVEHVEKETE